MELLCTKWKDTDVYQDTTNPLLGRSFSLGSVTGSGLRELWTGGSGVRGERFQWCGRWGGVGVPGGAKFAKLSAFS